MTREIKVKKSSVPAQKHRDARVLDGQLHRDAFGPPPFKSSNPSTTNRTYPNTFTPTPGAGKYQRKAEKLLWELENKLRSSKLLASYPVSSSFAEEDRFGGVVFDSDSGCNTIDGGLYASNTELLVMSGALSADDHRCELGRACFRTKIGEHNGDSGEERRSFDELEAQRGKRREESEFRGFDSGWYTPSEESVEADEEGERRSVARDCGSMRLKDRS